MKMRQITLSFVLAIALAQAEVPVPHYQPFPVKTGVIEYIGSVVTSLTTDGNVSWRFDAEVRIDSAGVGPEGTFYIGLLNGSFFALSNNGHVKWDFVASCKQNNYRCYVPDAIHLDNDGSIFLRTSGSASMTQPAYLYRLSCEGKLIWQTEVRAPADYSASEEEAWFGKKASKDLIFVRRTEGDLAALSKSDATLRWNCSDCTQPTPSGTALVAYAMCEADGESLITTKVGGLPFPGWQNFSVRKISAQDGSVLWTKYMPTGSNARGISVGADGTVYAYYDSEDMSGLVAISPQGESKWNITIPWNAEHQLSYGYPSDQDEKGNVLLGRVNCTTIHPYSRRWKLSCIGDTVTIHPDGSMTPFSEWTLQCPEQEGQALTPPPKPMKRPDGSVYFQMCDIVVVFSSNGDKKILFASPRGPPTFSNDGTIYIEREHNGQTYPDPEDGVYVVQVDSETGSDKWTHKLIPAGCFTHHEQGYQCFAGFCRVPTESWSAPPPACTQQGSDFCCYDNTYLYKCPSLCANNSKCVAFDFGPAGESWDPSLPSGQCCLFADPGSQASITGASDHKSVRGCWAPFSNPQVSFESMFPRFLV